MKKTEKHITKEEAEKIIEYFNPHDYSYTLIGNVLERAQGLTEVPMWCDKLCAKWKMCCSQEEWDIGKNGFTVSLQEILERYEVGCTECTVCGELTPINGKLGNCKHESVKINSILINSPAAELFLFLHSLTPTK